MPSTKVILIEDNPEFRRALSMSIEHVDELELVAKFGTAEKALRNLRDDAQLAQCDIILLDLNLPELSGLDALEWLRKYTPAIKVIVLTQSDKKEDVLTAIQRGAAGYLLKSANINQIQLAIESALNGGAPIDSNVNIHLVENIKITKNTEGAEGLLSYRELQVLELLGQGMIKKEIGNHLDISTHTVTSHVRNIYEKMHVLNAPAAITKAYELGILPINK